jgi:excisionase family DNA binding protein
MSIQIKGTTLYTVPEISKVLNVTTTTTRHYIKQGKLMGRKLNGRWVIAYDDLLQYLKLF